MPLALYAAQTGLLISGYAVGVVIGAPALTVLTRRWHAKSVLIGLMVIFTLGMAIDRGMGLGAVPIFAALFPLAGLAVAMAGLRRDRQGLQQTAQGCPAPEGQA